MAGSLSPLFERLITTGFAHLSPGPVTVLTSGEPNGEYVQRQSGGWDVAHEPSCEALSARAAQLLEQGSLLLIPPWERRKRSAREPLHLYEEVLRACRPAAGVMAVVTPMDLWVSEAPWAASLRQDLAEHWDTLIVLYGRGVISGIHSSFVVAVAFLRGRHEDRPPLKMFQVPSGADESAVTNDFEHLLARGGGRGRYGYVIRDAPSAKEGLDFDRHDPAVLERRADLAGFGSVSVLGDLCNIVPRIHMVVDAHLISSVEEPGSARLLAGRDIQRDGAIAPPSEDTRWVQAPATHLLKAGDLVLRGIYSPSDPQGFIVTQLTEQDLPTAAAHNTIALRPHTDIEPQRIRFALMFLRTPLARTLAGKTGVHVIVGKLRALPVPQPDEALTKAFDDLTAARQRLEEWQREADSLLESTFSEKTAARARSRIINSGRALRLRVEAASLLDELGHTVRTRYPYPVAYRWREVEARMSAGDPQAAYGAVLDTAEILLCYTAQLALARARSAGIDLGSLTAIKEKLVSGRSGPGFGDWTAVLNEVATSRKLSGLPAEHLLHDIRGLLADKDAAAARQRLSDRRNDQAHLRRIDPVDLPAAIRASFADLTTLMEQVRFLADCPLLHVTDVLWDALAESAHVEYRELMGDHPVVPTRSMSWPRNDLETGSLYVRDPDHQLHLLRPFLLGQDCPTCRAWSTFHVDRAPTGTVLLKSLEHGHVFEEPSPSLTTALGHVGLL